MAWRFERLDGPAGCIAEGPVWDGGGLLFTRIQQSRIMRYDPAAGTVAVWRENTNCSNGLTYDREGRLYACQGGATPDARRVVRFEPDGSVSTLAERYQGKRLNIPNDLVVDSGGAVWFTDPFYPGAAGPWSQDETHREQDHASVYRLDPPGWTIERVTFDTTRPNGILFSLDYRTLYVAQSGRDPGELRQLRAYPVRDGKTLGPPRVLHDFGEHRGIDGMRLDAEGNIVATAGWELGGPGPSIYVFSPAGELIERHPVPARRPTNCCFGGADLTTLYVTTIDGELFAAATTRRGR